MPDRVHLSTSLRQTKQTLKVFRLESVSHLRGGTLLIHHSGMMNSKMTLSSTISWHRYCLYAFLKLNMQEHKLFREGFQLEADSFKLSLLTSVQSALRQLPTSIQQMKASDFLRNTKEDSRFKEMYNVKLQFVDNTTIKVLSGIKNLITFQNQDGAQHRKAQSKPKPKEEEKVEEIILEEREIQCEMSAQKEEERAANYLSQQTFGARNHEN